jgi:hypothetical protein
VNNVTLFNNCVTLSRFKRLTFAHVIVKLHLPAGCGELKKYTVMSSLLYIIAVILIIGWAVGFFAYSAGGIIHILLVIAIIAILFQVIRGRRSI